MSRRVLLTVLVSVVVTLAASFGVASYAFGSGEPPRLRSGSPLFPELDYGRQAGLSLPLRRPQPRPRRHLLTSVRSPPLISKANLCGR